MQSTIIHPVEDYIYIQYDACVNTKISYLALYFLCSFPLFLSLILRHKSVGICFGIFVVQFTSRGVRWGVGVGLFVFFLARGRYWSPLLNLILTFLFSINHLFLKLEDDHIF